MVKNRLLFVSILLCLALVSLSFVSAMPTFNRVFLNDTDNFYSNSAGNRIVNVIVNVTNSSALVYFTANYSNLTTSCGTGGVVDFSRTYEGLWNTSCNVGAAAEATSGFSGGGVIVTAIEQTDPTHPMIDFTNITAVLYNMTTPPAGPDPCTQFGSSTTNFKTGISNFGSVNFVVHMQMNISCVSGGRVNSPLFRDMLLLNLTSVNLSTQTQAAKLSLLSQALNVTVTPPKQFGNSRIFIDTNIFAELSTNASVKLFNLPFAANPAIIADNVSNLNNSIWVSNGFDASLNITTGNLTINVLGFSGYNVSDNRTPVINIPSPITNSNSTSVSSLNVTVNGTGTEPSQIIISLGGNSFIYNSTYNSANCTNITTDGETYRCLLYFAPLSDGQYTLSVTAYDYGGSSGNSATNTSTFGVDTTGPVITESSPLNGSVYYINQSITVYFTATDATTYVSRTWWGNGTTNSSFSTSNPLSATMNFSSTGMKNITFFANDSLGNRNNKTIQINITAVPAASAITNDTTYTVNSSTTNVIVPFNATLQNITLTNTSQIVTLDLSQSLSNGNVTLGGNNFTLTNQGTYNYTAFIPSGTTVIGGTGWDGKIIIPVVNVTTFTAPSGTTNVVVDLGSSGELNFSSAVKITIGGMAGKSAAWSRGSSTLTAISTTCDSAIAPTNIATTGTRECSISSGSDLIIWTYHFTSFAAYTPAATSNDTTESTSSGGATTTGWSATYTITTSDLNDGYTRLLGKKERVKFKINDTEHYVGVTNVSSSSINIEVASTPQSATLNIGETKKFDIDGDNIYDLEVTFNSFTALKASVTVKAISEQIPAAGTTQAGATGATAETKGGAVKQIAAAVTKSTTGRIIFWIVLVVLIVVIAWIAIRFAKRNSHYHRS